MRMKQGIRRGIEKGEGETGMREKQGESETGHKIERGRQSEGEKGMREKLG